MHLDSGPSPHNHHGNGSAASRTVTMSFPALAAPANESAPAEQPDRDVPAEVYRALVVADAPMTVEQIQTEIGGEPRVPEGPIVKALADMIAEKRVTMGTRDDGDDTYALAETTTQTLERSGDIIAALLTPLAKMREVGLPEVGYARSLDQITELVAERFAHPYPQEQIRDDLDSWIIINLAAKSTTALGDFYEPTAAAHALLQRRGVEGLLAKRHPLLLVDLAEQVKRAESGAKSEHEGRCAAEVRIERLRGYLLAGKMSADDIAAIMDPPAPVGPAAPKREEFAWEGPIEWSPLAELELRRRDATLRGELARYKLDLEAESGRYAAAKKRLAKEIAENQEDIDNRVFRRRETAYSETLWGEGVILVRSVATDEILERKPIPRGTQRSMPTEPAPKDTAEEAGKVAASTPAPDPAVQAAADAANAQEERAAAVRGKGPKGEINLERYVAEASTLLKAKGASGLSVDDAPNDVAHCIFDKVRVGHKTMAQQALSKIVDEGKAIERRGRVIWAELAAPDDGGDEDPGPASGER